MDLFEQQDSGDDSYWGYSLVDEIEDNNNDNEEWHSGINWIKKGMQRYGLPCNRPGRGLFFIECYERLRDAFDRRYQLALESAIITGHHIVMQSVFDDQSFGE